MDLAEALFHANWSSSCSAETPSGEYSEMMAQLLSTPSITNNREPDVHVPSLEHAPIFWSDHCAESSYFSYNSSDPSNGCLLPPPDLGCHNLGHPNAAREYSHTASSIWNIMGFCAVGEEEANAPSTFPVAAINEETSSEDVVAGRSSSANQVESAFLTSCPKSSPKRKSHVHGQVADSIADAVPRKKLRSLQKNGKNEQPRKTQKGVGVRGDAGESINGGGNGRDSGSCISEEESTSSQEVHGRSGTSLGTTSSAASDPNGKARAGRGTSTDPQSLYARKRRERINERLRILQSLVPNGTKVDISTMLEEAVQYVKFLQLQIKLLSSDELWMYAPIAYNGMDIGQFL